MRGQGGEGKGKEGGRGKANEGKGIKIKGCTVKLNQGGREIKGEGKNEASKGK